MQKGDFSKEFLEKIAATEPQWMREKRLEAYALYESLPMPHTTKDDVWRRTVDMRTQDYWRRTRRHLRSFAVDRYHPSVPNGAVSPEDVDYNEAETAGVLVQVDGQRQHTSDSEILKEKGVYFADLHTALQAQPELFRSYFMNKAVTLETALKSGNIAQRNKFDALHGAFWQGGYLLHVPKGVRVEVPLRVYIRMSEAEQADLSHTLIIAEEGSQVVVLEDNLSTTPDASGFHSGAVEIFAGQNANVTYVQVQRWNRHVWNFASHRAMVARDAQLCWVTAMFGGRLNKINQAVVLEGAGGNAKMLGLAFTDARQHLDVSTAQEHVSPHTFSDLLYRTVLKDRAQSAWGGNIYVYPSANHTDAYQKNDNLLLSERAHADTLPGLEIQAHEVRCTHGATAGKIDAEQVFYLMSRGLSYTEAEKLIVEGFFEPVMERIPLESVREELNTSITRKLVTS
ncbi:Fe-S cluster assembly protein SufD [Candidatus Poribacteria bacterium]|nr:Fe-S cluster assembly protein SufD [Candidatus Poribacteria bacterium]MYH80625.1 Fe-S cluster assembly protein SufD [Candidatus Poribacteria bacterium]MYK95420.1 Fe-S cluster assembly protein SufD [Candidatus Poribacteria bacterium]